jgi:DNA-binding GntR family transcriptional regulator
MSCKEQAYDYLQNSIILNKLAPGSPIIEMEVAKALQMSRTPVREALKELDAEGLVTNYPLRGTFVSMITPYDVEEIFTLRIALEVCALHLSINRITDDDLDRVESMFADSADGFSWEKNHQADKALHSLIVDKAGNKRLKDFLGMLNGQIERFRRIATMDSTRSINSKVEHIEILKHLRNRDLEACEESLKKHLNQVMYSTLEIAKMLSTHSS